jgi:hypothetical protein
MSEALLFLELKLLLEMLEGLTEQLSWSMPSSPHGPDR